MKLTSLLLALCLASPALAATPDRVDEFIAAQMHKNHVPGMAVAVIKDGVVVKLQSYGKASLESGADVTVHSAFQIASATKMFTGVLVMDQVAQGKLRLDAPVSDYLADVPGTWRGITIRHLLSHTSGMAPGEPDPSGPNMEAAVAAAKLAPLAHPPGQVAAYGSNDYVVLAHILERVSGKRYADLLQERVLEPQGLADTGFEDAMFDAQSGMTSARVVPNRVRTYRWHRTQQRAYWFVYPGQASAAGGLFSSITDLARFLQALDRGTLLRPELREEMWKPYRLADGSEGEFAQGWVPGRTRGQRSVGHSGGPALSDVLYFPEERLGVIVLSNQGMLFPNLAQAIASHYLPAPSFLRDKGIVDDSPALTRELLAVAAAMSTGTSDPGRFSGDARSQFPGANDWLALRLSAYGLPQRLVLLEDKRTATGVRTRVYRALYGEDRSLRWRFVVDAGGVISEHEISSE